MTAERYIPIVQSFHEHLRDSGYGEEYLSKYRFQERFELINEWNMADFSVLKHFQTNSKSFRMPRGSIKTKIWCKLAFWYFSGHT